MARTSTASAYVNAAARRRSTREGHGCMGNQSRGGCGRSLKLRTFRKMVLSGRYRTLRTCRITGVIAGGQVAGYPTAHLGSQCGNAPFSIFRFWPNVDKLRSVVSSNTTYNAVEEITNMRAILSLFGISVFLVSLSVAQKPEEPPCQKSCATALAKAISECQDDSDCRTEALDTFKDCMGACSE
jgi:hypothetical protein